MTKNDSGILSNTMCFGRIKTAMLHFRNKVISEGKPADDINELLLSLMGGYQSKLNNRYGRRVKYLCGFHFKDPNGEEYILCSC